MTTAEGEARSQRSQRGQRRGCGWGGVGCVPAREPCRGEAAGGPVREGRGLQRRERRLLRLPACLLSSCNAPPTDYELTAKLN